MYKNILVALDGSPISDRVLHEAIYMATVGTKIIVITIVENPLIGYAPVVAYDYAVLHDALLQESKNILDKARRDLLHINDICVETHVIDMNPNATSNIALAIENAAKEYQADLIVLGNHGRSGLRRMFIGSIAEKVIRQSLLPVLLIRDQSVHSKEND